MVQTLIIILIIWWFVKRQKEKSDGKRPWKQASAQPNVSRSDMAPRGEQKASAVPNKPKKKARTKEEVRMEQRTRESRNRCDYQAAYSKGKPDRIGKRGDYEPVTPKGMERISCPYCNASNFIPAGSRDHYHCYFCWEKL